ncbi:hypothetical protein [Martelella sp. FOR1707]
MDNSADELEQPGSRKARIRFVALAALTGILTGSVGSVFHLLIDRLQTWPRVLVAHVDGNTPA